MLDLTNTTLLFVETRAHEITKRVIADCMAKASFGGVLIYTDRPDLIPVPGARYIDVPDFPNKKFAGQFYYAKAMMSVETDFALMLEWDAGIFDPDKWLPQFFDFDYIGAPWVIRREDHGVRDVGNGGFTLMSRVLGRHICEQFDTYPVFTDMDVCHKQRHNYERAGFKWPKRDLAAKFSWELGPRDPNHFGYHGAFNWPTVLSPEEVLIRARLMLAKSDYMRVKANDLFRSAPHLVSEFTPEELALFQKATGFRPRPPLNTRPAFSANQRAAMLLLQAQRRGLITAQQQKGLKA